MEKMHDEIQKIIDEVKRSEQNEFEDIIKDAKKKLNDIREWDVTLKDEIEFFDPTLSYELTGYRPINKEQGLDFNPDWFTETRKTFQRTGKYCQYKRNSKAYADFWIKEYIRCREGLTVNNYTVTGDHYFFLNYYQLMDLSTQKAGTGRLYDFPKFFVAQYEFFHYLEMCKKLRKNVVLMKARGVGHTR